MPTRSRAGSLSADGTASRNGSSNKRNVSMLAASAGSASITVSSAPLDQRPPEMPVARERGQITQLAQGDR